VTGYSVEPKTNISPGSGNPGMAQPTCLMGRLSRSLMAWVLQNYLKAEISQNYKDT